MNFCEFFFHIPMEEWRGDKMFIPIIHTVDTKDSCIQTVTTLVHLFPTWNTHRLPTRHFDRVLRCSFQHCSLVHELYRTHPLRLRPKWNDPWMWQHHRLYAKFLPLDSLPLKQKPCHHKQTLNRTVLQQHHWQEVPICNLTIRVHRTTLQQTDL